MISNNDAEFTGEARQRNKDFALGWSGDTKRGGMSNPEEIKIAKGTVLIRIGHSVNAEGGPMPDWQNLTSPWWMTDSTFLDIAARGESAGTAIHQMVRMKLALTPDFGICDTLFWVVTRQSLRAWNGRGNPVMEDPDPAVREAKGRPLAWYGAYELAQNYIPGLRTFGAGAAPTACALASLAVLPKLPLSAYANLRKGGFAFLPFPYP